MMTDASAFISGLMAVTDYSYSEDMFKGVKVHLTTRSCAGGSLTLQAQRSGVLTQTSEGILQTPLGGVSFNGTRRFASGRQQVAFTHDTTSVSGRLRFPPLWGIVSFSRRAELQISGRGDLSFDIWKPSKRYDTTVAHFRPHDGEAIECRLLSQKVGVKMFPNDAPFAQLHAGEALVLLAALLYMCMSPGDVIDKMG